MVYGHEAAQGRLLGQIDGLIGHEGARAVQDMLAAASEKKETGIWASLIGLATLLFAASGAFGELQDALNGIWQVKAPKGHGFLTMIRHRFLSFSMVIGTGFLLLISLILSTVLSALNEIGSDLLPGGGLIMEALSAVIGFGIVTLLFAGIFKYVPDIHIRWRNVWVGAAITATLFSVGKFAIGLYLGHSAMSSAYGAGGSLVVMLVWVYYSSQILFFGAEFTQVYTDHREALETNAARLSA